MYKHAGFGLIEVLISITLISVGMLGMATLQTSAIKLSNQGSNEALASMMAADMISRILANPVDASKGPQSVYASYSETNGSAFNTTTASFADDTRCYGDHDCSFYQIAQADLQEWKQNISTNLPEGTATISAIPIFNNDNDQSVVRLIKYQANITWRENGELRTLSSGAVFRIDPWKSLRSRPAGISDADWAKYVDDALNGRPHTYPIAGSAQQASGTVPSELATRLADGDPLTANDANEFCAYTCRNNPNLSTGKYTGACTCNKAAFGSADKDGFAHFYY